MNHNFTLKKIIFVEKFTFWYQLYYQIKKSISKTWGRLFWSSAMYHRTMDPSACPDKKPVPSVFEAKATAYESVLYKVLALLLFVWAALIFPSARPIVI